MTVHVLKTIPLGEESRKGWKDAGGVFIRRHVSVSDARLRKYLMDRDSGEVIVNLGRTDTGLDSVLSPFLDNLRIYNLPESVRAIKTPKAIRKTLSDFLAPWPSKGEDYWVKRAGQGGTGKQFFTDWPGSLKLSDIQDSSDRQKHIEGIEYRVISVGAKVVQAHKKEKNGSDFDYSWVGVTGINKIGIIPLIHKVVEKIPSGNRTVIGWDIIHDNKQPWIIEANSSPGVNIATAHRIVKELV